MDWTNQKIIVYVTSPIIAKGLQLQLEDWGFRQVENVSSSNQVLVSIQKRVPALLVLDTDLEKQDPAWDCFALARKVQGEKQVIPVLFIDKTVEELRQLGDPLRKIMPFAHGWLSKPCHPEELWQGVSRLLETGK